MVNTISKKDLQNLGNYIFKSLYNEDLTIEIKENPRLKNTLGWFLDAEYTKSVPKIELSSKVMAQDIHIVADVLAHELTHYYLYEHDQPNDDFDVEFETLTYANGITRTNSTQLNEEDKLVYKYFVHEGNCECGYYMESYVPVSENNFRPIFTCPVCKKHMEYKFKCCEYRNYIPTPQIKAIIQGFLSQKSE